MTRSLSFFTCMSCQRVVHGRESLCRHCCVDWRDDLTWFKINITYHCEGRKWDEERKKKSMSSNRTHHCRGCRARARWEWCRGIWNIISVNISWQILWITRKDLIPWLRDVLNKFFFCLTPHTMAPIQLHAHNGNTHTWRRVRKRVEAKEWRCEECLKEGGESEQVKEEGRNLRRN